MAALSKTNRTKVRVIVGVLGLWIAIAIGTALWPRFPSGNCPDTPPDTAYVCRVAFGQDFEKASRRRNVLVVLEIGVLLSVGSALWLLSDKPLRRRSLDLDTGSRRRSPADAPRRSKVAPASQPSGARRAPGPVSPAPPAAASVSAPAPAAAPVPAPAPAAAPVQAPAPAAAPVPAQPTPPSAQVSSASAPSEPAVAKARRGREEKRAAKEARKAEKLGRRAQKPSGESPKSGKDSGSGEQSGGDSKA